MMREKIINQYAYHRFLPEHLHQDAEAMWRARLSHRQDWFVLNARKPEFFCSLKGESDGICS